MSEIREQEVISRRGENLKTYYLGKDSYRAVFSGGMVHYKDDYSDDKEQWKEIDLRWDGSRLTTTPYILEVKGDVVTFTDKKTGDSVAISASRLGEASLTESRDKIDIVPFNEGVKLQWQITESDVKDARDEREALSAEFNVDIKGKSVEIRASATDADGDPVPIEYEVRDGKLYENVRVDLFESKDEKSAVRYPITVDPTLTVQPSSKDAGIHSGAATTNYGGVDYIRVGYYTTPSIRNCRGLVEFGVDWGEDIPSGVTIDSADLELYAYLTSSGSDTFTASRLLRLDWVEDEATWNIYKTGSDWQTAGAAGANDFTTTDAVGTAVDETGWHSWAITNQVKTAQTNDDNVAVRIAGTVTSGASDNSFVYRSRTATDTSQRPKLTIEYTEAAAEDHKRSAFFPFM